MNNGLQQDPMAPFEHDEPPPQPTTRRAAQQPPNGPQIGSGFDPSGDDNTDPSQFGRFELVMTVLLHNLGMLAKTACSVCAAFILFFVAQGTPAIFDMVRSSSVRNNTEASKLASEAEFTRMAIKATEQAPIQPPVQTPAHLEKKGRLRFTPMP